MLETSREKKGPYALDKTQHVEVSMANEGNGGKIGQVIEQA